MGTLNAGRFVRNEMRNEKWAWKDPPEMREGMQIAAQGFLTMQVATARCRRAAKRLSKRRSERGGHLDVSHATSADKVAADVMRTQHA